MKDSKWSHTSYEIKPLKKTIRFKFSTVKKDVNKALSYKFFLRTTSISEIVFVIFFERWLRFD